MLIPWILLGATVAAGSYAYLPSTWCKARHWMQRADRLQPNVLYLTFDDGPDPGSTHLLLDLLAKYQVHATFFVVANSAQKYPELSIACKRKVIILAFTLTHITVPI